MAFKVLGPISKVPGTGWSALFCYGNKSTERAIINGAFDPDAPEPQKLQNPEAYLEPVMPPYNMSDETWAFGGYSVRVRDKDIKALTREQIKLEVKYAVVRHDKHFHQLRRSVEAFENLERVSSARRERIPQAVRLFVWQRDDGKCVRCGNTEKLEFDHIIPVAKGGSNTERNIQLLCEACNRSKGAKI